MLVHEVKTFAHEILQVFTDSLREKLFSAGADFFVARSEKTTQPYDHRERLLLGNHTLAHYSGPSRELNGEKS